jgi:glycogen(starch) synthase
VTSQGNHQLPDEDSIDGISIHRFRLLESLEWKRLDIHSRDVRRLRDLKMKLRPDVVHVMFTDPTVIFHWQTDKTSPVPTVIGIPIGVDGQKGGLDTLLGTTLARADWVLTVSEAMLSDVRAISDIESKSSVIHNSIDEAGVAPTPLPFHPARLLCLGRVAREKGFDVALDAFREIVTQFPGIRLVIAGDGVERNSLMRRASALGVEEHVDFPGWISPESIAGLINSCTAMIIPSRWREAFGNVALQAMQMGRPVIASNVGGLPEIVIDHVTGYLIPPENPVLLAGAFRELLSDYTAAVRMGEAGRVRAASQFQFSHYVDLHEQLYRRIIEQGPSRL